MPGDFNPDFGADFGPPSVTPPPPPPVPSQVFVGRSTLYRTSRDLVLEALANLGVLVAGQNPDVEDYNYVNEKLDSIFQKLNALEICLVPDPDNIPGLWFSDLAAIVAGETAMKFGVTPDDFIKIVNAGLGGVQGIDVGSGAAAKSLRQMNRGRPTGEVLISYYY